MDVTIKEIDDKLKTKIFDKKINPQYKEREDLLKRYIDICIKTSLELVQMPEESYKTLNYYKQERIKKCLRRISDYVGYLTNQLEKEKIIEFCSKQNFFISNYDIDLTVIVSNSYYGAIKHDLYWIEALKYKDALDISSGKFDINKLSEYLPGCLDFFDNSIIPFFQEDEIFKEFHPALLEIKSTNKMESYRASNLLILTVVEGLVRKLGEYLIEKQDLEIDHEDKKFNSLDSFLRKIPWKKDYEIRIGTFKLINNDFDYRKEYKPHEKIKITLKERLDFLRRRFKEDRDTILHGLENDYGKKWNVVINMSALEHVFKAIVYYRELYK